MYAYVDSIGRTVVSAERPKDISDYITFENFPETGGVPIIVNGVLTFYPPVAPLSPSELRQQAYENNPIISYNDKMITVDEAEKLFWQYFPEDNECCDELKTLIKNAKAQIREMYPDEN